MPKPPIQHQKIVNLRVVICIVMSVIFIVLSLPSNAFASESRTIEFYSQLTNSSGNGNYYTFSFNGNGCLITRGFIYPQEISSGTRQVYEIFLFSDSPFTVAYQNGYGKVSNYTWLSPSNEYLDNSYTTEYTNDSGVSVTYYYYYYKFYRTDDSMSLDSNIVFRDVGDASTMTSLSKFYRESYDSYFLRNGIDDYFTMPNYIGDDNYEPTTEEPTTEPSTEEPTTEPSMEEPTVEPSTEEPIYEPSSDDELLLQQNFDNYFRLFVNALFSGFMISTILSFIGYGVFKALSLLNINNHH